MIDFAALFRITVDPLEIVLRGTVMYWFLFALIRHGAMVRKNMRRELVTVDELRAKLRAQGIEKFEQVKLAFMESDGEISVIRERPGGDGEGGKPSKPGSPVG